MMNEPKRRYVNDLPEKLEFLATAPQVRQRHRLSISALSKACGQSVSWLKSAKDSSRETQSIATEVERKLAKLCYFDPSWPEWRVGTAADFKQRHLAGKATPTDHPQAKVFKLDNPAFSCQFLQHGGTGECPNVTIQNFSNCSRTVEVGLALLLAKTLFDASATQKLQAGEIFYHFVPTALKSPFIVPFISAFAEA